MDKFPIISKSEVNTLPKTAGVYLFLAPRSLGEVGSNKSHIIYIGKAIDIKSRVKNHFSQPTYKDNLFIQKITKIGFINTDSEIEALVLEANLIKKYLPKYNVVWKDGKNYFFVAIAQNSQKIPYVYITHQIHKSYLINHKSKSIGPFIDGNALKKTLKFLRKAFPYYTTSTHPKQKCTWCHLDLCPGPNPDLVDYKKNIKKLTLILQGKSRMVLNSLKKEMKLFSNSQEFENAGKVRDKLQALENIIMHTKVIEQKRIESNTWDKTQTLLQEILNLKNPISKIECYDISNIQGKFATGSMVVFTDGNPDKPQYKKFRIRVTDSSDTNLRMTSEFTNKKRNYDLISDEPNDIAMLKQVITRRLARADWPYPQIMLIDGGIAQLNVAIKAKNNTRVFLEASKNTRAPKDIRIISIAKGKRELLIEGLPKIPLKDLPQEVYNLIVALDDEAHRFAITYHKKLRQKALLK